MLIFYVIFCVDLGLFTLFTALLVKINNFLN